MPRFKTMAIVAATFVAASGGLASATETTTYNYDALGRLVTSTRSGGPNNNVTMSTCFDRAGNRVRYDVTGTPPAACPSPAPTPSPSP